MLSPSLEDYLEEIYRFSVSNDIVRVTDISQKLNVKLPSVTKALGKLRAGGYITYQKYGMMGLTDKGRQMGCYLVERNTLLQDFLRTICADCDVAAEAEAMEHYLSKSTISSIKRLMGFMKENTEVYQRFVEYVQTTAYRHKG
ncbi:MAG TPA: iron dependent repressor, metal binding and dimerization domain protein [Methylomusa anaerophila]|uniref:Transcriptional regulator MntR n=1 Tax=Methylomusa anaerophila TaxID=1930071 RepID=A0A348AM80_9FIRM|nr:iron dependent repressor, metal binding and dimerization domain protein [Methylomusa anaerophila]BBB92178.1 transcriptional regulator MntR [Methylomusa anaerophila]HML87808.1 iron dependent repressor, metal binding and dimerization domain protein [Methylomusa anaerophila]